MTHVPTHTLNDGHQLPAIGLGTYRLREADGVRAVVSGIESGYRLLDTAVSYENEAEVGEGIRASGLDRDELVVTTKIRGRDHGFEGAARSVEGSLARLGLDRLDLVLIHWPNPSQDLYVDTWRGLVDLRERGLVRSIGVSNFTPAHLERVIDETGVTPAVNQVELHPRFAQADLRGVHDRLGIRTQSWSPLGARKPPFDERAIADAAESHGVTPAQVVLRWHVQLGAVPIPKSQTAQRRRATSTSSASSSTTSRWPRSGPSTIRTAGSGAGTPRPTRRCDPLRQGCVIDSTSSAASSCSSVRSPRSTYPIASTVSRMVAPSFMACLATLAASS